MKKNTQILFGLALVACSLPAYGQINKVDEIKKSLDIKTQDTVAWTHGGVLTIGMNEGLLHNWAAGGELASFTVNTLFNGHLDRLYKNDIWSNNLDLSYGLTYNYSTSFKPKKTDDRIDFTSRYCHKIKNNNNLYFTSLFNFKSQFTKGYNYNLEQWDTLSTSKFLAPAYFTIAVGLELRKGDNFTVFYSPIAGRLTLVDKLYTSRSAEGAFGVPYNKTSRYEFGSYFSGRYATKINKNVNYRTRLDLYSNYLAKNTTDSLGNVIKRDNPGNVTILFDNLFSFKFSKHVNMNLGATFIYDHNIPYSKTTINAQGNTVDKNEPVAVLGWLQMKQIFSFGLEYKF